MRINIPFKPRYKIRPALALDLMRIESAREAVAGLPITPQVLASLRQTARLKATHYSTQIEGNQLEEAEVAKVLAGGKPAGARERDQAEVRGYFAALQAMEALAGQAKPLSEGEIRQLHGLVMGQGRKRVKPSAYRDGQNVIKDSRSGKIVYLPPEAKDVPKMVAGLVQWLQESSAAELPEPLRAGLAHYQLATIHPYYDGNGRLARLVTSLLLQRSGYGLRGLYSLEEYYAQDLAGYYQALTLGPSHNYYQGRAEADLSPWLEYFCAGMRQSFDSVRARAAENSATPDQSIALRNLDPRQRRVLELFQTSKEVTAQQIGNLLGLKARTARIHIATWVKSGYLKTANPSNKTRSYCLGEQFKSLAPV